MKRHPLLDKVKINVGIIGGRMMKRAKIIIATSCVAIFLLLICILICSNSDNKKPVRISQNEAVLKLERKCYLIESNGRKILGESTFTAIGNLDQDGKFKGSINVAQYPIPEEILKDNISGEITESFLMLSCQSLVHSQDGSYPFYNVSIVRANTDIIVIYIHDSGNIVTAVCAETEEEAWSNFDAYVETLRGG